MVQLVIFLAILSVLVLVHEWGHYICAKIFGVRVEEFGFGLPPFPRGSAAGFLITCCLNIKIARPKFHSTSLRMANREAQRPPAEATLQALRAGESRGDTRDLRGSLG